MKLLLFADLHLDAQFAWADRETARKRRASLREALLKIIDLAEETGANAVLCGGDLYEHDRFSPDTAKFVHSTFEAVYPLPIYIAPGNHDWYGPGSLYHQTNRSPNVHVFRDDELYPVELADGLTLWGAAHRAPANTDNFLEGFRVKRSGINLALFHGSERSGFSWQGQEKAPHAAFEASHIEDAGFDHAFLGHYHNPNDAQNYTYPGNPAPLTFGEKGERGAVIAEISDGGKLLCSRYRVAPPQIFDLKIDVTGCASAHDIRERVATTVRDLTGAARLTLEGELAPEIDFRPQDLVDAAPHLETLVVRAGAVNTGYDFDVIAQEPTVRGQFVRDALASDLPEDERRRVLVSGLRALDGREDLEVI